MTLPLQIAFLTGQSNPASCALSATQAEFINALEFPESCKVRVNFPYNTATQSYMAISLPVAGINNIRQYFNSRHNAFVVRYRKNVLALLEQAQRTLFIAGSCGVELLQNLHLPAQALSKIWVIALGPVARRLPACPCLIVQGRHDYLSRLFFHHADIYLDTGHLSYLKDPQLPILCNRYIQQHILDKGTVYKLDVSSSGLKRSTE